MTIERRACLVGVEAYTPESGHPWLEGPKSDVKRHEN